MGNLIPPTSQEWGCLYSADVKSWDDGYYPLLWVWLETRGAANRTPDSPLVLWFLGLVSDAVFYGAPDRLQEGSPFAYLE